MIMKNRNKQVLTTTILHQVELIFLVQTLPNHVLDFLMITVCIMAAQFTVLIFNSSFALEL